MALFWMAYPYPYVAWLPPIRLFSGHVFLSWRALKAYCSRFKICKFTNIAAIDQNHLSWVTPQYSEHTMVKT